MDGGTDFGEYFCWLVHSKRLELLNLSVLVPKTSAYTNSATSAYDVEQKSIAR